MLDVALEPDLNGWLEGLVLWDERRLLLRASADPAVEKGADASRALRNRDEEGLAYSCGFFGPARKFRKQR